MHVQHIGIDKFKKTPLINLYAKSTQILYKFRFIL